MSAVPRITNRMPPTIVEGGPGQALRSPRRSACERSDYQGQGFVAVFLSLALVGAGCMSAHRNPARASGRGQVTAAQSAAPPSSIILPDGTSLTLKLVSELSSATAKVGDAVEFVTAYPVREEGFVVIPKGAAVSGTVLKVSHGHRPARNGEVKVKVEKLLLTDGRTAALRLSKSGSAGGKQILQDSHESGWIWLAAPLDPLTAGLVAAMAPFFKGQDVAYPKGMRALVYFDGSVAFDRDAVSASQPAPYKGQPQVFVSDADNSYHDPGAVLFCDDVLIDFSKPLRLELKAGTHAFRVGKEWDEPGGKADLKRQRETMQLSLVEDHQYWIERYVAGRWPAYHSRLRVRELPQNQLDFDIVQSDLTWESASCVKSG